MASHRPFIVFLLAVTVFRIVFSGMFNLIGDEAHFWLWSKLPALSYPDHPPMVAWFILVTGVFGDAEWAVRLSPVLSGSAVMAMAYYVAAKSFNDNKVGMATAILFLVVPMTNFGGFIITSDTPGVFFWTLCMFLGYMVISTQKNIYWYLLGIAFGGALLSKYNTGLYPIALFVFMLFSYNNRHHITRKEPWLGVVLSVIVFSPVLIHEITHDWISFQFQIGRAFHKEADPAFSNFLEFWAGQIGLLGGFTFPFIIASAFGIGWLAIKEKRDDWLYLAFLSAPLIVFYAFNSFKTRMEGNWAVMSYIAAMTVTPGFIYLVAQRMNEKKGKLLKGAYNFSVIILAALMVYLHIYIVMPQLSVPTDPRIARRWHGWDELGVEIDKRLKTMKPGTFIMTDWYQVASLLHYYTPGQPDVYIMHKTDRFFYYKPGEHLKGKDALFMFEARRAGLDQLKKQFEKVEPAGELRLYRAGKLTQDFRFFRCINYKG